MLFSTWNFSGVPGPLVPTAPHQILSGLATLPSGHENCKY